jgi:hypothetical protein
MRGRPPYMANTRHSLWRDEMRAERERERESRAGERTNVHTLHIRLTNGL